MMGHVRVRLIEGSRMLGTITSEPMQNAMGETVWQVVWDDRTKEIIEDNLLDVIDE